MKETELYGDDYPGERGNTRAPKFGEPMRGVWAGTNNPQRDGLFVRTVRRTGRMNSGTWHELTDGKGNFWKYEAKSTVFLTPNVRAKLAPTVWRQAQAGENVPRTARLGLVTRRWGSA